MKINANQLAGSLKKTLAKIYLLSGNEPLLLQENHDLIFSAAKKQGFSERKIFDVGASFHWESLLYEAHAPSLFTTQRIVDCRLSSLKVGDAGSKALRAYAANPAPDTLLLITLPKLDANALKSRWLDDLMKNGVLVQIWPIEREHFPAWIAEHLQLQGLPNTPRIVNCIASHTEGNLFAAKQEIDKLSLLKQDSPLDESTIENAITQSCHFTVFDLVSSTLAGNTRRSLKIISHLQAEKIDITLALWAISQELRLAASVMQLSMQKPIAVVFKEKGVWQKRQHDMQVFLKRHNRHRIYRFIKLAARIDRHIKGMQAGNPWLALERLTCEMTGINLLPTGAQPYV